jgi:ketosteroid isomerase-like protein
MSGWVRIACHAQALALGLLLLWGDTGAARADPPATGTVASGSPAATEGGGFFSSLKQAFSQDAEHEDVRGHFDVGSHRYYCLVDPKTGKKEPQGVTGQPFLRRNGTTGIKAPAVSPQTCADAEQKGILVTTGYAVKGSATSAGSPPAPVAPAGAAASVAPAGAAASVAPAGAAASVAPAGAAASVAPLPAAAAAVPLQAAVTATAAKAADNQSIEQAAHGAYVTAINSNDVDTLLADLTDDVVYQSPGEAEIIGKPAVRRWLAEYFGATRTYWEKRSIAFVVNGDWAFERYTYKSTDTDRKTGAVTTDVGKGINIFRRGSDGRWRVAIDGWSSDRPAGH